MMANETSKGKHITLTFVEHKRNTLAATTGRASAASRDVVVSAK